LGFPHTPTDTGIATRATGVSDATVPVYLPRAPGTVPSARLRSVCLESLIIEKAPQRTPDASIQFYTLGKEIMQQRLKILMSIL